MEKLLIAPSREKAQKGGGGGKGGQRNQVHEMLHQHLLEVKTSAGIQSPHGQDEQQEMGMEPHQRNDCWRPYSLELPDKISVSRKETQVCFSD